MKKENIQIVTNIERLSNDNVYVKVTCNDEVLDEFKVNTKNTFDIMLKAKDCIAKCTKQLMKYR